MAEHKRTNPATIKLVRSHPALIETTPMTITESAWIAQCRTAAARICGR
jgi:hypothetical protein